MGRKIILNEAQFRTLIDTLYETYAMVSYKDVEFDIMECFKDVDENLLRTLGDNVKIRIKYRYTPASRSGNYDVPDNPASYQFIDCEVVDKNMWNILINESGLSEEQLKSDIDDIASAYIEKIDESGSWVRE